MTWTTLTLALLPAADPPRPAGLAADLAMPVHVRVNGRPLDVERSGHAAPFVGDFDGDGVRDLLVGQFGDGILWVYKNVGTDKAPRYAAGAKFKSRSAGSRAWSASAHARPAACGRPSARPVFARRSRQFCLQGVIDDRLFSRTVMISFPVMT